MKYLAHIVTISRMIASFFLLIFPTFGCGFWAVYAWCGLSDMMDGTIARKTGSVSHTGALLDSGADLLFVCICFVRILPEVALPVWLWIWVAFIALLKVCVFLYHVVFQHRIAMPHTLANKLTGLLLFLLPVVFQWMSPTIPSAVVCMVATYAAIQERRVF